MCLHLCFMQVNLFELSTLDDCCDCLGFKFICLPCMYGVVAAIQLEGQDRVQASMQEL